MQMTDSWLLYLKCTNDYLLCVFTGFVSLTVSTATGTTGLGTAYTLQNSNKTTSSSAFNVERALLRIEIVRWFLAWERKPFISSIAKKSRSKDVPTSFKFDLWHGINWSLFGSLICVEMFDRKESSPWWPKLGIPSLDWLRVIGEIG